MKLRFFGLAVCLPAMLACAACSVPIVPEPVRPSVPPAIVLPPPARPPAPPATGPWTDWPITAGDWVYRTDDRGSVALFGPIGRDAIVTFRCDRTQGKIYFSRADYGADYGADYRSTRAGSMTIRASSALKTLNAKATGGAPAYIAAEFNPADTFLDALIFTRGRIAVEAAGQNSIAIPVWAEIAKVVEDCRG